ncbi:MAG: IS200/IS605 family transposase [Deltaproteobacteria bacterium]|nr:IS200/IS605 family transposase [Deltaproteobacteria bacterium]
MTYRHGSHTVFTIHLHLVWITKYRKKVLVESVALRIREICQGEGVDIIKGHVSKDHVHLFVSLPPQVTINRLVQRLKGKTSFKLLNEFPHLRKTYWGRHFWARGYFCCSSGNVTDEMIIQYIEKQDAASDDNFKVEGDDEKSA